MFERIATLLDLPLEYFIRQEDYAFEELESCIPPGRSVSCETMSELINAFLDTISQTDVIFFIRRYYMLNSNAEISENFGVRTSYVRNRLSKTIRKFKAFLKERA